jgi:hypothetical protein
MLAGARAFRGTAEGGLSPQGVRKKSATATVLNLAWPRQPHSTAQVKGSFGGSAGQLLTPLKFRFNV